MKQILTIIVGWIIFNFLSFTLSAQENTRICYTDYMTRLNARNFDTSGFHFRGSEPVFEDEYFIIPVVVHIIHNNGPENISDERVISQIEVLNEDFGHYGTYNKDERGEDTRIRFCLASRDPEGNPTSGIVRVQSPFTDLQSTDEMKTKNLSRWDQRYYLNIWVVKSIDGSSDIQGYSYTPSNSGGPVFEGDGIVISYKYFGKLSNSPFGYKLGRTTTHEVGHYLNLKHPWGGDGPGQGGCDDDDGIFDTPNCSLAYDSAIYPHCIHPKQCGNIRMIENFMEYSTDGCMTLFTPGQGEKMREAIKTYRADLVSYNNLVNRGCVSVYDSLNNHTRVKIYPNPAYGNLYFETHSKETYTLEFTIWDILGRFVMKKQFDNISKGIIRVDINDLNPGFYILKGTYADNNFSLRFIKSQKGF